VCEFRDQGAARDDSRHAARRVRATGHAAAHSGITRSDTAVSRTANRCASASDRAPGGSARR